MNWGRFAPSSFLTSFSSEKDQIFNLFEQKPGADFPEKSGKKKTGRFFDHAKQFIIWRIIQYLQEVIEKWIEDL